ncbi:MAG: hypothetical protein HFJ12_04095 [Bacilli bacterium]|nr:hypothetical protein [Bacilli bacterium]
MNINPNKVKELVLVFSELDEEYQKKLLGEAYKLQLMQTQKRQIQRESINYKNENELQQEIEKRSNQVAKEALDLIEILDKASDTDKAAMFMLINQLSGKANTVQESDIVITVNQKDISMKEYLEKHLANADYDKAKSETDNFMNGIRTK